MPKSWTATHDQQLLLLILKTHKIDSKVVANAWSDAYADDPTTAGAITQHIAKLARKVGGAAGSSAATPKIIAPPKVATPRKLDRIGAAPKTPSSASGRKRVGRSHLSDDDMMNDNDNDHEGAFVLDEESPAKRQQIARKSKTPGMSYRVDDSDGENVDVEGERVTKVKLEHGLEEDGSDYGFLV